MRACLVAIVCSALAWGNQSISPPPSAAVVDAVVNAVSARYVFPEVAPKIVAVIREQARKGAYDTLTGGALADALTRDLRVVNGDQHLYVTFQPGAATAGPQPQGGAGQSPAAGPGPVRQRPGSTPAARELLRRRNYHLNRVERLEGNVGYLEIRQFYSQADEARHALAGAMAFLAQTDAMIIDVRSAPGGDAGMVDLVASFFFDQVTPTLATSVRGRDEIIQRSTLAAVPGTRRPHIPVFVLTSRDTGSAAEDFAFLMQQTRRATLVGDRTAGAGHMNAVLGLGAGYALSVSIGRTFNPSTNEGWEGTGVQPDLRVPPAQALNHAHHAAITTLAERATDASLRRELEWTRDTLDARRAPHRVDEGTLESYAGQYGVRFVTFERGQLWYQRTSGAEKLPLLAVSTTDFALGEGQRVRFVVAGSTVELRLLMTDGSHIALSRSGGP